MDLKKKAQEIKKKYNLDKVHALSVETDEGTIYLWMKQPSRQVLSASLAKASSDPVQANEIVLNSCVLKDESDMRIITNDDYFFSVFGQLQKILDVKKSELQSF